MCLEGTRYARGVSVHPVKVRLYLCLIMHHDMKTYKVKIHLHNS